MKDTPSLDDLALFLAVCDAGGLAGAAVATGSSAPTLSRRMVRLEQQTGRRLFARGARGYALTADGRALRDAVEPVRGIRVRLATAIAADTAPARVRITAGIWTARFLARSIASVWSATDRWVPAFLASNAVVDIARREADIGIRNRRPDQPWLAGRRTFRVDYAAYATSPEVTGYVGLSGDGPTTPSDRWLRDTHADRIATQVSDPRLAMDLALAGIGRVILPIFAGEPETGLVRVSDPIPELSHDEWLVAHHEARHDPPVRAALDAIGRLLTDPAVRPGHG